jgi:predicted small lipoprotein YifL
MKRRWIVLSLSALFVSVSLSACGQKGPLRLPDAPKAAPKLSAISIDRTGEMQ